LPKRFSRSASNSAAFGIASSGSNGLDRPRSAAVPGMNCAMPRAPAGLMALGLKLLSRQISLVRKATGRPRSLADVSIMRQMESASDSDLAGFAGSGSASAQRVATAARHAPTNKIDLFPIG
jgi:hypothetical protein